MHTSLLHTYTTDILTVLWGGPNISVGNKFFILFLKNKFRGVHIYRKIGSGGTNFGGNKFVMTGHILRPLAPEEKISGGGNIL